MKTKKRIGIWMDYTSAQIYENASGEFLMTNMESNYVEPIKHDVKLFGETNPHTHDNEADKAYFSDLIDLITGYQQILLFGPDHSKTILYNKLKSLPKFNKVHIEAQDAEKMTSNHMKNYVKDYFSQLLTKEKPFAY
jgi:hypothetical protein